MMENTQPSPLPILPKTEAASATPLWYAIYTRPRWEKKVHRQLEEEGIESYLPLNIVHRKYTDRVKKVQEPLFRGYIFVRITPQQATTVRYIYGVLNFVYWLGKPAIIRQVEIEAIKRFLGHHTDIHVLPARKKHIVVGDEVRITAGLMMGKAARVGKLINKKLVELHIDSIGQRLVATVDIAQVEKLYPMLAK
jgi:transcription antitermination factor NusG